MIESQRRIKRKINRVKKISKEKKKSNRKRPMQTTNEEGKKKTKEEVVQGEQRAAWRF